LIYRDNDKASNTFLYKEDITNLISTSTPLAWTGPQAYLPSTQTVLKVKFLINHKKRKQTPILMGWGWVLCKSLLALQPAKKISLYTILYSGAIFTAKNLIKFSIH